MQKDAYDAECIRRIKGKQLIYKKILSGEEIARPDLFSLYNLLELCLAIEDSVSGLLRPTQRHIVCPFQEVSKPAPY